MPYRAALAVIALALVVRAAHLSQMRDSPYWSLLLGDALGYTHQNGIVDDRFRKSFPAAKVNDEYRMTLDEFLERFEYLAQAIEAVDDAARNVFKLAAFS